jgi:DNA repair exonuclease SbcCD ATPase subunit
MVVGICLRLALHTMFANRFPLLVLDEGSTHLDQENRTAYFNVLATLKQEAGLGQIIVVDHDPDLAKVADVVERL